MQIWTKSWAEAKEGFNEQQDRVSADRILQQKNRKTEKQKSKQGTTAAVFRNCEYFCERLSGHSNFNHQSDTDVKSRWA